MFDHLKLSETDKIILEMFYKKRRFFNEYIASNKLKLYTCPGCGYPTLSERGGWEICAICNWEDDNQDDSEAHEIWGGPNANLSLTENRINIGKLLDGHRNEGLVLDKNYAVNILKTIENFEERQSSIGKRMTGNENLQHPIWEEWKQIEKDLQLAINKLNKSSNF